MQLKCQFHFRNCYWYFYLFWVIGISGCNWNRWKCIIGMSKQINCYHVTFFNDITSFFSFCKLQIISTWVYVYLVIYGHQIQPSEKTTNTIYFANITTRVGHIGSWSGIHSKHEVIWKAEYIYYVLNPKQGLNVQFTTCICVQDTQYVKDVLVPIGCGITGALLIVIVAYLWRNYWCRPKHTQQTPMVGVKVSVASWELPKKPGRNNSLTSL